MCELAAQVTSGLLHFPEVTVDALGEDEIRLDSVLHGKFTAGKSGLAWLACGPHLEVVQASTGERFSAYCFSGVSEHAPNVLAVHEFCWLKRSGLLVGLEESAGSILCLYDLSISRVVKAVVIPGRITAIEPLVGYGGASTSTQHLHQSLRWFFGVVAVVTDVGHVLLVDLCLDDPSCSQSELEASDLEVVNKSPAEVPHIRERVTQQGRHLCLQLSTPTGTSATALQYVTRTNLLAVGFSDGYLQLWNMKTLKKEYHAQLEGGRVPVYAFTFQEPENDPRNCCYLWAVQSTQDHEGDVVSLHLLQLAFGERKCLALGKILYEGLEYCEERYSQDLNGAAFPSRVQATNVCLLGCQTIEKFRPHPDRDDSMNEGASPDTSVSIFSWQVKSYGQCRPTTYVGLFDINRWYHAQMPDSLRAGETLHTCPYLAVWSLDSVVEMTSPCSLLDIVVHERSLSRGLPYTCPLPEQFFNPTTYNFEATCLLNSGLMHVTCSGYQKETLSFLKKSVSSLSETIPDGYSRCLMSGLLSPCLMDGQPSILSQKGQLDAVLSAAVETSSLGLITGCIKHWTSEEQPGSAVNLCYILDWAWNKVVLAKEELDGICEFLRRDPLKDNGSAPLFDSSTNFIDPQTLQLLLHSQRLLGNLSTIFHCLLNEAHELTQKGLVGLINKNVVSSLISQYAQVVLWFCRTGLLPEGSDDDVLQISRPFYNYPVIKNYYTGRREELLRLSRGKWCSDCLMIDGLVGQYADCLGDLWKRDGGGTGQYPPPTLHALLDIYLLENMDESAKHAIVIYLLLDIMYSLPNKSGTSVESFPTAFAIPIGLVKLVQGLWLLDHLDHENSVELLLHPATNRSLWAWQHGRVLQALMCQGQHAIALRYLHTMSPRMASTCQIMLCLSVLLHNRCIVEAWALVRQHSNRLNMQELLRFLYATCLELGLMEELFKLPLGLAEQDCLESFLQGSGGSHNHELLMVHYLQQANYVPALQLNQALRTSLNDPKHKERSNTRNSILDQYGKVLPRVQRKLATERVKPYHHPSTIHKEVSRPQPLSTLPKRSVAENVLTRASFLSNVLTKIGEVWEGKDGKPQSSLLKRASGLPLTSPHYHSTDLAEAFVGTPVRMTSKRMSRILALIVQPSAEASPEGLGLQQNPTAQVFTQRMPGSCLKPGILPGTAKAPEFSLLQTPPVVKRARALAVTDPVFPVFTPQSILRSSLRPTPVGSPSASPARSATPPPRLKESRITFIEESESKDPWSNGIPAENDVCLLSSTSPLPKPGVKGLRGLPPEEEDEEEQDTLTFVPQALLLRQEADESESYCSVHEVVEDEEDDVVGVAEICSASACYIDSTMELHEALTQEDPEDKQQEMEVEEVVAINMKSVVPEVSPLAPTCTGIEKFDEAPGGQEGVEPVLGQEEVEFNLAQEVAEPNQGQRAEESELRQQAEESELGQQAEESDLGQRAEELELRQRAEESELGQQAEESDQGQQAEESDLGQRAEELELGQQAGESELGQQAEESELGQQAEESELGQRAEESELRQRAEESELGQQAEESDQGQQAEESELGQQAGESELGQQAEESDQEQRAGESELRQRAEESELGQQAEESDQGQQAEESELGQQAGESELGQQAEESDQEQRAGESELGQQAEESDQGQQAEESELGQQAGESDQEQRAGESELGQEVPQPDHEQGVEEQIPVNEEAEPMLEKAEQTPKQEAAEKSPEQEVEKRSLEQEQVEYCFKQGEAKQSTVHLGLDEFVEHHLFGDDLSSPLTRSSIRLASQAWATSDSECSFNEAPTAVGLTSPGLTTQKSVTSVSSGATTTTDSHSVVSLNDSEELSGASSEEDSDSTAEEEDSESDVEIIEQLEGDIAQEAMEAVGEEEDVDMVDLEAEDRVEPMCFTELRPSDTLLVPLDPDDEQQLDLPKMEDAREPEEPYTDGSDGFTLTLAPLEYRLTGSVEDSDRPLLIMQLPQPGGTQLQQPVHSQEIICVDKVNSDSCEAVSLLPAQPYGLMTQTSKESAITEQVDRDVLSQVIYDSQMVTEGSMLTESKEPGVPNKKSKATEVEDAPEEERIKEEESACLLEEETACLISEVEPTPPAESESNSVVQMAEPDSAVEEVEPEPVVKKVYPVPAVVEAESATVFEQTELTLVKEEVQPGVLLEEAESSAVPEDVEPGAVVEEAVTGAVVNKVEPGVVVEEAVTGVLFEEAESSAVPEEVEPGAVVEEAVTGVVVEEAGTGVLHEEAESSAVPEEAGTGAVVEAVEPGVLVEEAGTGVLLEEAESSAVPEEVEPGAVVEEAVTGAVVEEAVTGAVVNKVEPGVVVEEAVTGAVVEEAVTGAVVNKVEPGVVVEEAVTGVLFEEAESSTVPEEMEPGVVVEEAGTGVLLEEAESSAVPEEAGTGAVVEAVEPGVLVEEAGTGVLLEEAESSAVPEEVEPGAVVEEAGTGAIVEAVEPGFVVEEAGTGVVVEEAESSAVPEEVEPGVVVEEATTGAVVKAVEPGAVVEEAGTGVLLQKAESSAVLEEVEPGAVVEEAVTGAVVKAVEPGAVVEELKSALVVKEAEPAPEVEEIDPVPLHLGAHLGVNVAQQIPLKSMEEAELSDMSVEVGCSIGSKVRSTGAEMHRMTRQRKTITFHSTIDEAKSNMQSMEEKLQHEIDSKLPLTPTRFPRRAKCEQDSQILTPRRTRRTGIEPEPQKEDKAIVNNITIEPKTKSSKKQTLQNILPRRETRRTQNSSLNIEDVPDTEESIKTRSRYARKTRVSVTEVPGTETSLLPEAKAEALQSPGMMTRKSALFLNLETTQAQIVGLEGKSATPKKSLGTVSRSSVVEQGKGSAVTAEELPPPDFPRRITRSSVCNYLAASKGEEKEEHLVLGTPLDVESGTELASVLIESLNDKGAKRSKSDSGTTIIRATRRRGTVASSPSTAKTEPPLVTEELLLGRQGGGVEADIKNQTQSKAQKTSRRTQVKKASDTDCSPPRDSFLFSPPQTRRKTKDKRVDSLTKNDIFQVASSAPATRTRQAALSHTVVNDEEGAMGAEVVQPRKKRTTRRNVGTRSPPPVKINLISPMASPELAPGVERKQKEEGPLRMNLRRKRLLETIFPKPVTRRKMM